MTDRTHPDSGRIITSSDILLHDAETALLYEELRAAIDDGHESMTHSDALAEIAAIRAENTELRAQLEAIGAGGVSGPLIGCAAPPTAQAEGWVSVEERLPPVRTTVFIASGAGPSAWRTLAFYDPDRYTPAWRCNDDPSEGIRGVSHWMHMPLPPTSAEGVEHG